MMRNVFIQEHAIDIVQLRATIAEEQCTFFQFSSSVLTFLDTPAAATLRCWGAVLLRVFRSAEPAQGVVVNACTAITAVYLHRLTQANVGQSRRCMARRAGKVMTGKWSIHPSDRSGYGPNLSISEAQPTSFVSHKVPPRQRYK